MTNANDPIPQITRDDEAAGSGDLVAGNISRLKGLFPQIVTDGKVDFDVLRELLGDALEDGDERYGLNWKGKRKARAFAMTPSLGTLRPAPEDSKGWGTTQNILIEGDNLEVLKLLRRSYAGKIRLIYIDPPYNTGSDFVYPDRYQDSLANYLRISGQLSSEGLVLTTDVDAAGRLHTNWLNMMYPRLMLAKELMSRDGVILISIDEKEVSNLTVLMDEVFGRSNSVGTIAWKASTDNNPTRIAIEHEYIVCYASDAANLESEWKNKSDDSKATLLNAYEDFRSEIGSTIESIQSKIRSFIRTNRDTLSAVTHYDRVDENGLYTGSRKVHNPKPGGYRYDVAHPRTGRPCVEPLNGYRYPKATMDELVDAGRILFGNDENQIVQIKEYLDEYRGKLSSVFTLDSRSGANELDALMGEQKVFTNPKPVPLLSSLFDFIVKPGDIVLDFFAGSGSTGHAVLMQNATDGGNRRYILVQLPEPIDPDVSSQKIPGRFLKNIGAPLNIAELTKERLRRAGNKVEAESGTAIDTGFRVYKLATSNLKPWQPDAEDLEASILDAVDNVLPGRTEEDLLVELLLKTGIDLTLPEEKRSIAGQTVHSLGGGTLMVCLGNVGTDDAEALGQGMADWVDALDPVQTTVYFKDTGLGADGNRAATKANIAAILRQRLGDRIAKIASI